MIPKESRKATKAMEKPGQIVSKTALHTFFSPFKQKSKQNQMSVLYIMGRLQIVLMSMTKPQNCNQNKLVLGGDFQRIRWFPNGFLRIH